MDVLSVTSELYPLIKTGGLADVAGALPLALKAHGVTTKTLVPGYPVVMKAIGKAVKVLDYTDLLGESAAVLEVEHGGLSILVLDAPAYFDRPGGPYVDENGVDYPDNWKRFAALSRVGADIAGGAIADWRPDLVHLHDWQAALTPVYMRYDPTPEVPSIFTIHNIAFQGNFSTGIFPGLRLPSHAYWESLEYYGGLSFMKAGLRTAHAISTVSPSYAEEILTPEFGMGMQGLIASRANDLYGIINGIDAVTWNPATDPMITETYSTATLKRRGASRRALCTHFGLDEDDGPIFCIISRLTWQKGMDIVVEVADEIAAMGGKLAILGGGDTGLETALMAAANRNPGRIGMTIGYNEPLSHLMQAGADALLVPSRFEPCGLTQLYALRYGCIPVVARTGGLNDTIINANEVALAANVATGLQFSPVTAEGLRHALRRTFRLFSDRRLWSAMQRQGMKSDVSWGRSGARYADLYASLLSKGH